MDYSSRSFTVIAILYFAVRVEIWPLHSSVWLSLTFLSQLFFIWVFHCQRTA